MNLIAHDPHGFDRRRPVPAHRRGRTEAQALDAMLADLAAYEPIEPDARAECDATRVELATAKAAAQLAPPPPPEHRRARREPGPFDLVVDELSRRFHDLPGGRQRIRRELPEALYTSIRLFNEQRKEPRRA